MSLIHPDLLPAIELLRENKLVCITQREDGEGEIEAIYLSIVRPDGSELGMIRLPIAAENDMYGQDEEADIAADEQFVSLGRLFEAAPHLAEENKALKLALGEAAGEIYCSGSVAHRIRVLKGHHNAQIWRLIDERDAAVKARDKALRDRAGAVAECERALSDRHATLLALSAAIERAERAESGRASAAHEIFVLDGQNDVLMKSDEAWVARNGELMDRLDAAEAEIERLRRESGNGNQENTCSESSLPGGV